MSDHPYNHTREDSALLPCPLCADTDAERELAAALMVARRPKDTDQRRADLITLLPILNAHRVRTYEPRSGALSFFPEPGAVTNLDSVPDFPTVSQRTECKCGCTLSGHSDHGPCYNCVACRVYEEKEVA